MRLTRTPGARTPAALPATASAALLVLLIVALFTALVPAPAAAGGGQHTDTELRQPYPLREGDRFHTPARQPCAIGALVPEGYVTAGHCGSVGTRTVGFNGAAQGVFTVVAFPGDDYGLVETNSQWYPVPSFAGTQPAPVGSPVCKTSPTTGTTCGTITARNVTVSFPQGTVHSLIRTDLCSEPGDSGAPVASGDQLQGLVSGASGNCSLGGTTYIQPINPVLSALGTTLLTV